MAILISSIPFLSAHMEEKENHFLRYSILRTGVKKYVSSSLVVSFLSAFSICVLGTLVFLLKEMCLIPFVAQESFTLENFAPMSCLSDLMIKHTGLVVAIQTVLYGVLCGVMCVLSINIFHVHPSISWDIYDSIFAILLFLLYFCRIFAELSDAMYRECI